MNQQTTSPHQMKATTIIYFWYYITVKDTYSPIFKNNFLSIQLKLLSQLETNGTTT